MKYRVLALATFVAACGGGGDDPSVDAPRPPDARPLVDAPPGTPDGPPGPDAPPVPDAPPGTPDAPPPPDAAPPSVIVSACTGLTPDATIVTIGNSFSPATVTITAGQVLRFAPVGPHNMTSGTAGSPDGEFATPTSQEACLRFTQPGAFPFYCSVHPTLMQGVVTVN